MLINLVTLIWFTTFVMRIAFAIETKTNIQNDTLKINSTSYTSSAYPTRQDIRTENDEYVARSQKNCFESRNLVSCMKYRVSKIIWKLATNSHAYFPQEYSRELREDGRRLRIIQLGEPYEMMVFTNARSMEGDSEFVKFFKFLKRATETFGRNHALQLTLSSDTGMRITNTEAESRGHAEKKRRKWLIILPLIILMKIAHLKFTTVTLLLGVLGLNVLLVGGTGWIVYYLKHKTLCKIHPHLVQSHSHVYDADVTGEYSQFAGSSLPGPYYGASYLGNHEINTNPYANNWGTSKAYNGYKYLDTISKRLK